MHYLSALLLLIAGSLTAQNYYLRPLEIGSDYALVQDAGTTRPGDAILLYQFGGASAPADGAGAGIIGDIGNAGGYATTRVAAVAGNRVTFTTAVGTPFVAEFTQLVGLGTETDLFVDGMTVRPFDGRLGGVAYFAADASVTVSGAISAAGAGFRGGRGELKGDDCNFLTSADGYTYPAGNFRGTRRGEGIVPTPAGAELGRAPLGNGGGGGNDHNTGGAGGANAGDGGGGAKNIAASPFLCPGNFPGLPASALPTDAGRIFFGGGGGAGHANNTAEAGGGHGGGIVIVDAPRVTFRPGAAIDVSGRAGTSVDGDGAGGGGAGGTIVLLGVDVMGSVDLNYAGGKGGDTRNQENRCFGPGGGGGGGRLVLRGEQAGLTTTESRSGGAAGVRTGSTICGPTDAPAGAGGEGISQVLAPERPLSAFTLSATTVCPGASIRVSDGSSARDSVRWTLLPASEAIALRMDEEGADVTIGPGAEGRFRITQTLFLGTERYPGDTLAFTVVPAAGLDGVTATVTGDSVTVSLQNARGFTDLTYDFGDGSEVTTEASFIGHRYSSEGTYAVTVRLSNAACGPFTSDPVEVVIGEPTRAFILEKDPTGCPPFVLTPFDLSSGNYAARRWDFPGAEPVTSTEEKPSVTYHDPGVYTATLTLSGGTVGPDTVATLRVVVFEAPQADFTFADLGNGEIAFTNRSEDAVAYRWNFGDGAQATESDPTHQYASDSLYRVTLIASGTSCRDTITYEVQSSATTSVDRLAGIGVRLYPNPTDGIIRVSGPAAIIEAVDLRGRRYRGTGQAIDLTEAPAGMYLILLGVGDRRYAVKVQRR